MNLIKNSSDFLLNCLKSCIPLAIRNRRHPFKPASTIIKCIISPAWEFMERPKSAAPCAGQDQGLSGSPLRCPLGFSRLPSCQQKGRGRFAQPRPAMLFVSCPLGLLPDQDSCQGLMGSDHSFRKFPHSENYLWLLLETELLVRLLEVVIERVWGGAWEFEFSPGSRRDCCR